MNNLKWTYGGFVVLLAIEPALASEAINLSAGNDGSATRIENDLDSWAAFAIVVTSLVTAWCMNAVSPKARSFGTILASLGCLAVAAWFFLFVLGTGILENPKPNQTPLDSAKPTLLWLQGIVALAAGLFLLLVGIRQFGEDKALELKTENEPERYGRISRLLHWSTAMLFIAMIPMGIFASIIPEGTDYRNAYYVVHKTIGVLVFVLLATRLIWNLRTRRPALAESLNPVERKLAHWVHVALYGFLFALPVTGFVMTSFHGYPTFFFIWELPPLWAPSDTGTLVWGLFHKYLLPYVLYITLGAHILGALKHHYIDKHPQGIKRIMG